MVTIAAGSGAGSALLGAGLASSSEAQSASFVNFAGSLAQLPQEQLRSTATGMLGVLLAQDLLSFPSTAEQARSVLATALVHIVNEQNAHAALSSDGAREWVAKRKIVENAIEVIDERFPFTARSGVVLALDKPNGAFDVDADQMKALLEVADPAHLPTGADPRLE